jgi:hypothetical protein
MILIIFWLNLRLVDSAGFLECLVRCHAVYSSTFLGKLVWSPNWKSSPHEISLIRPKRTAAVGLLLRAHARSVIA